VKYLFSEMSPRDEDFVEHRLGTGGACVPGLLDEGLLTAHSDAEVLSVMVHSPVGAQEMDALPRLRLIATRSTGFDHIDLDEANGRGIVVSNVPAYGSNTVAEHTFALMLALSRKVHKAYLRTLHGEFKLEGLMGFDLADKTLGVVGAGRIGQHVVRIAKGFGMNVIVSDPYGEQHLSELLGFRYASLDELLQRSHVIALCCPLNSSTRHLIGREAFQKMRRGAILVNTARGAIVDSKALLWALNEGVLAGAGLDVLEGEELLGEDTLVSSLANESPNVDYGLLAENLALMRHPNLIVTPHMAFYSSEALQRILETTIENILGFESGSPLNVVNPPVLAAR
jgi:D-lactate dehydrogenase